MSSDTTTFVSQYDGFTYRHNDPVFHHHIERGQAEPYPKDLAIVQRYLHLFPHKCRGFVDVGGHIGTTVMPFLRLYERCISYEPNPTNYRLLVENIQHNGLQDRAILKPVGCSDRVRVGQTVMHEGGNTGCYYFKEEAKEAGAEATLIRLDDDPDILAMDVDFLKMDTEGHELFVLRGGEQLLRRCRPLLQLEMNGFSEKHFGITKGEIIRWLHSIGAREFSLSNGGANVYYYFPNPSLCIEPKTIFCFWTGDTPMSDARRACLGTIPNARIITPHLVSDLLLPSAPLHAAYPYLSETHKADYLRTYFMHHYGGGYADIKHQGQGAQEGWSTAFQLLESDPAVWAVGYPESCPDHIAHPAYRAHWQDLIGNCAYVIRPNTPFTKEWYSQMLAFLDSVLPALQQNPARGPQDCAEKGTGYPIEWNQMLGRIFHPLVYKYREHVRTGVPRPLFDTPYR